METQKREKQPYPLLGGFPAPITALELPKSKLDTDRVGSWTIHHRIHPNFDRYRKAGGTLLRTLRHLVEFQDPVQLDIHSGRDGLHDRYLPPVLPPFAFIFERLAFAYDHGEPLRRGSFQKYTIRRIHEDRWDVIKKEYRKLRESGEAE